MKATRSENLFLPPPKPQESWKEFMSDLEGVSKNSLESATPQTFLRLLSKATPPPSYRASHTHGSSPCLL